MNYLLIEQAEYREKLKPFTFTRPISEIRIGILTIKEKWEKHLGASLSYIATPQLQNKFPKKVGEQNILINSSVCPTPDLVKAIQLGASLKKDGVLIAAYASEDEINFFNPQQKLEQAAEYNGKLTIISEKWHIFQHNGEQIKADYALITSGRNSQLIDDPHTIIYNGDDIFIEEGAQIKAVIMNAEDGPIYIGKNTVIAEGTIIKGPFAICENSRTSMGSKFRGDNTIGPGCKVGGEVSNTVFFGYSNKGHDGFIGNSVIGEWCNLGAATNTSNLKNNYAPVKSWDYASQKFADTGLQFCGLMMGDHSKSAINTMFNTGTVVGVCSNIFGAGFPRNFIPSFAWGGSSGFTTFQLKKAFEVAKLVMQRRGLHFTDIEKDIIEQHFEESNADRFWDEK